MVLPLVTSETKMLALNGVTSGTEWGLNVVASEVLPSYQLQRSPAAGGSGT